VLEVLVLEIAFFVKNTTPLTKLKISPIEMVNYVEDLSKRHIEITFCGLKPNWLFKPLSGLSEK
jgi:hypothetical protein